MLERSVDGRTVVDITVGAESPQIHLSQPLSPLHGCVHPCARAYSPRQQMGPLPRRNPDPQRQPNIIQHYPEPRTKVRSPSDLKKQRKRLCSDKKPDKQAHAERGRIRNGSPYYAISVEGLPTSYSQTV